VWDESLGKKLGNINNTKIFRYIQYLDITQWGENVSCCSTNVLAMFNLSVDIVHFITLDMTSAPLVMAN
jgi:hypothetical protein